MYFIYYFLIAFNIGLFKFPPGLWQAFSDFLNISFFVYSLIKYYKTRKEFAGSLFSKLEISYIFFLLYFSFASLNSLATSKYGAVANLRYVYPFFLFFSTIVFLNSQEKINTFIKVLFTYAFIGTFITIIQSIYGSVPMFDIDGFYHIGHWAGQMGNYVVPGFARVMLPPLYLIYILFLGILYYRYILEQNRFSFFLIFFSVPILIGFARSHWIALIITFLLLFVIANGVAVKKIFKLILSIPIIIVVVYLVISSLLGETFIIAIEERFLRTFLDLESGQGTFGNRLITIALSVNLWLQNPLWGNGVSYMASEKLGRLSDVGFTFVLVSIGIVGLILVVYYYLSIINFSYRIIRIGKINKNIRLKLSGMISMSVPVFLFISQHFTQSTYIYVLLILGSGYCVAQYRIFLKEQKLQNSYTTMEKVIQ